MLFGLAVGQIQPCLAEAAISRAVRESPGGSQRGGGGWFLRSRHVLTSGSPHIHILTSAPRGLFYTMSYLEWWIKIMYCNVMNSRMSLECFPLAWGQRRAGFPVTAVGVAGPVPVARFLCPPGCPASPPPGGLRVSHTDCNSLRPLSGSPTAWSDCPALPDSAQPGPETPLGLPKSPDVSTLAGEPACNRGATPTPAPTREPRCSLRERVRPRYLEDCAC